MPIPMPIPPVFPIAALPEDPGPFPDIPDDPEPFVYEWDLAPLPDADAVVVDADVDDAESSMDACSLMIA